MKLRRYLATAGLLLYASGTWAIDVNTGDQAALDGIKGLGPSTSRAILAERQRNGNFRNWGDFENRVRGIGAKKANQLSRAGLTVNGRSKPGASVPGDTH